MSVWRNRLQPGALVSWRHSNGRSREAGIVVAVGDDTLRVNIKDHAGSYEFEGGIDAFPGLRVDLTPEAMHDNGHHVFVDGIDSRGVDFRACKFCGQEES